MVSFHEKLGAQLQELMPVMLRL
jgi:hypothetical protein